MSVLSFCSKRYVAYSASILSVNGGAIALGHPLGATGVRQGEEEDNCFSRQ